MSKYNSLWKYIQKDKRDSLVISFEEIKNVLGFKIDHSFLNYKKELENYGYKVKKISLKDQKIKFVRVV